MAECEKGFTGGTRIHRVTVVAAEVCMQASMCQSPDRCGCFTDGTLLCGLQAEDLPICWICLDGPSIDRPLMHPCRCPSYVHSTCIARWQLQSAGTRWVHIRAVQHSFWTLWMSEALFAARRFGPVCLTAA